MRSLMYSAALALALTPIAAEAKKPAHAGNGSKGQIVKQTGNGKAKGQQKARGNGAANVNAAARGNGNGKVPPGQAKKADRATQSASRAATSDGQRTITTGNAATTTAAAGAAAVAASQLPGIWYDNGEVLRDGNILAQDRRIYYRDGVLVYEDEPTAVLYEPDFLILTDDGVRYVSDNDAEFCPPGLAKKEPACIPPGLAKKMSPYRVGDTIDAALLDEWTLIDDYALYGLDPAGTYYRSNDYLLQLDPETREVMTILGLVSALAQAQ